MRQGTVGRVLTAKFDSALSYVGYNSKEFLLIVAEVAGLPLSAEHIRVTLGRFEVSPIESEG